MEDLLNHRVDHQRGALVLILRRTTTTMNSIAAALRDNGTEIKVNLALFKLAIRDHLHKRGLNSVVTR